MAQPSDVSGSTHSPILQLSNPALPESLIEKDLPNDDASSPSPGPQPAVQSAAGHESHDSEPPLRPISILQNSGPPIVSTQEKAGSSVPRPPHESELQPELSPRGNVNRTQSRHESIQKEAPEKAAAGKPKFNIYQTAREMYKAFVGFPLAFNSFLVMTGICTMLAGTFVVHAALLPKIYTCPDGATCQHNLDPSGDIVPRLPTLMQYWLQGGVFVASLGLSKFMAYESWTIMEGSDGSTIRNLEREIGAVDGKLFATFVLFYESIAALIQRVLRPRTSSTLQSRRPRWLGTFALVQFGIGFFISLVVGFSITDLRGARSVYVPFIYHSNIAIPRQDIRFASNGDYIVVNQLTNWLLPTRGAQRPISVFDGTLVLRDNRTLFATNPQPSGSRITGNISCSSQGWNTSVLSLDSPYLADGHGALPPGAKAYNLTDGTFWAVTYSYTHLSSTFLSTNKTKLSDSVTSRQYLWASNTSNVIPNATASSDGGLYFALCTHTTRLVDLPPVDKPGTQDIFPSQPIIYKDANDPFLNLCPSTDPMACLSWFIDEAVYAFWVASVVQFDMTAFSCVTDVLVGFDGLSDTTDCALDDVRWATTLSTTLDALIYTAGQSENATQTQYLSALTDSINADRWWIQTTLPGVTFLLYLACLVYTSSLSPKDHPNLRELALSDILCDAALECDTLKHDVKVKMDTPSPA